MTTSRDLGQRSANGASPMDRRDILDQARTTVVRSSALVAEQREALDAVRASLETQVRLRRGANGSLANRDDANPASRTADGLTPRQLEILGYLADGLNTRQIAERLWLSRATVRNHVSGIFAALDCHSRLEAVSKARQRRLI
jgi:DNA-binding NarL/FixJ family response regulator